MATPRMDVTPFVGKLLEEDDVDLLREGVRVLAQAVMETEVSSQIGADPYERSSERTAYRNRYRTRTWDTRVGTIELKIPKVTAGAFLPSLLEPRRRAEKGPSRGRRRGLREGDLHAQGRRPGEGARDRRDQPLGGLQEQPDEQVQAFLGHPIESECPHLWLDASGLLDKSLKQSGRVWTSE